MVGAFHEGLSKGGLIEGSNVAIEHASTEQYTEMPALARALVRHGVAVIAALGGVPAKYAKAATTTIPIVFSVGAEGATGCDGRRHPRDHPMPEAAAGRGVRVESR
jgi:putative ABC transport system substrate-binding protein